MQSNEETETQEVSALEQKGVSRDLPFPTTLNLVPILQWGTRKHDKSLSKVQSWMCSSSLGSLRSASILRGSRLFPSAPSSKCPRLVASQSASLPERQPAIDPTYVIKCLTQNIARFVNRIQHHMQITFQSKSLHQISSPLPIMIVSPRTTPTPD